MMSPSLATATVCQVLTGLGGRSRMILAIRDITSLILAAPAGKSVLAPEVVGLSVAACA
jgi:hypothetical protein